MLEVIDTYNKEGFWIKSTVNGIPVFIPKEFQETPRVCIFNPAIKNCEWFMTKRLMTEEEFQNFYPDINK
jgi:hypothetical protein